LNQKDRDHNWPLTTYLPLILPLRQSFVGPRRSWGVCNGQILVRESSLLQGRARKADGKAGGSRQQVTHTRICFPGILWLDRARPCQRAVEIATECFATLPAGKALLEAEDHEDSSTDPAYWWSKQKYYPAEFWAIYEKTTLERAKRHADCTARDLATFPVGKALLEAEDHWDSAMDPRYWRSRKKYYKTEYKKLQQEFWDRWKPTHLDGGGSAFEALNDSKSKTRARQPSATKERRTTRSTRSTTQGRKETDQLQLGAIATSPSRYAGTKNPPSTERRKSKDRYRRRNA